MSDNFLTIALAGNPNSGKTTIFNNITGTRQKVGNWPGVTVEKKEGRVKKFGYDLKIIDLPGTYSLTPFSIEEIVTRDYILEENPDVVIDIIDASNLERNLYLGTQLRELDCNVLFALNMADVAKTRGRKIDKDKLSALLNVPVLFTVGNKNEGIDTLLKMAIDQAKSTPKSDETRKVKYSKDIEDCIYKLKTFIENHAHNILTYNPRWTAIKLLEDDEVIKERIMQITGVDGHELMTLAKSLREHLQERFNEDPEIVLTDERYGFIAGIIKEVYTTSTRQRVDISRNIDLVLTNRFIGFPIFLFFIWTMFQLTFTLGEYPMIWLDMGVMWISSFLSGLLPDSMIKDLLINGVMAGVGSVIIFLPNILILFFCIALFEDTGYMSRSAFLMDKIMHLIGLHGKSFIPMLMGFGCNVPAIMAARTLESEKDRILTILITPFMSCSAKLPVYIALAGAFFSAHAGSVIFAIYMTGIILSIITGRIFRSTLLKGEDAPFVMELPPYRVPMLKSLLIHMWDRSKIFLKKMGGIILVGSIVVWSMSAFPRNIEYSMDYEAKISEIHEGREQSKKTYDEAGKKKYENEKDRAISELIKARLSEKSEKSYMGRLGKFLAPIFAPIGIEWRGGVAILTGFVAKEIVVSTLGVLYHAGNGGGPEDLGQALRKSYMTPLSALSMMVFVLLYLPCLATITTIKKETGSFIWMFFSIGYSTFIAWFASFIVYQGGRLFGFS